MHPQCEKCEGRCCRYICFQIGKPDTYEDFEDIRWYLLHEAINVHIDLWGDWWILIENRCRMLDQTPQGWLCRDYDHRPIACRRLSPEKCDFTKGGFDYEELFHSADELDAYARRMLGEMGYEEARKQFLAKEARQEKRKARKQ